jgi:transaldolase
MFAWIPNVYFKYPCTSEGLKAAERSEGHPVNMTLCFSQEQAAAVYAATKGSKSPVYVSPFIGRQENRLWRPGGGLEVAVLLMVRLRPDI